MTVLKLVTDNKARAKRKTKITNPTSLTLTHKYFNFSQVREIDT